MKTVFILLSNLLLLILSASLISPAVLATIPEPANVLYGRITVGEIPVTAQDKEVIVLLRIDDVIIASYRMGDEAGMGDHYLLSLPLGAKENRKAPTVLKGDVATLYVSGIEADTFVVGDMGLLIQKDLTVPSDDYDHDGLPDAYESAHGLNPFNPDDALEDTDGDGLTNLQEYIAGTDPNCADTDHDGMQDGFEIANGFNPLDDSDASQDADGDGYTNLEEANNGTDPNQANTVPSFRVQIAGAVSAHNGNVSALAVEDETMLSASQHESVVKTWNLTTGELIRQSESGSQNGINALAVSGNNLFAGTGDGRISHFSLDSGDPIQNLTQVQGSILALAVYDDQLIGGSADGSVTIWGISTGVLLKTWSAHGGSFISGLQALNGKLYTLGTFPHKSMKIWDWNSKTRLLTLQGAKTCCQLTNLHLNKGKLLLSGFQAPGQILTIDLSGLNSQTLSGHLDDVLALAATHHRFFSGDAEGNVTVWSMSNGHVLQVFKAHAHRIRSVAANKNHLVTGDDRGQIKIWKLFGDAPSDKDQDGMADDWELTNGLDPADAADKSLDVDSDGLTNIYEYINQTDPHNNDTDADQLPDSWEVTYGFNPRGSVDTNADPDADGYTNLQEYENGTDPHVLDL